MCLGIPAKIIEIFPSGGLRMGKVDFGGVVREVCLEAVPEAEVGNYTIIHAGFALNLLSEDEAKETLDLLNEIAAYDEEFNSSDENDLSMDKFDALRR